MQVCSHCDYITMSYEAVKLPSDLGWHDEGALGVVEKIRPIAHYDVAWRLRCGGTFNTSYSEKQGSRIDLSGVPLAQMREWLYSDADVLMLLSDTPLKKRTTRFDYCWTIENAGSVRHTVNHWFAGKKVSTFRKDPEGYVKFGSRAGQTVWFGSKDNDQRVKVYDKGYEMGLLNQALLRVEMQTRKEFASALVTDAYSSSVRNAARSRLLGILDFPALQWWKKAIHGDMVETLKIEKRKPKWQGVYLPQVAESIRQHLIKNENNDREYVRKWLTQVVNMFNNIVES